MNCEFSTILSGLKRTVEPKKATKGNLRNRGAITNNVTQGTDPCVRISAKQNTVGSRRNGSGALGFGKIKKITQGTDPCVTQK